MAKTIAPNLWEKVKAFFDQTAVTESGDDKGIIFTEQISVGTEDNPKESCFGSGDSIPVAKAYQYTTDDETGIIITGATDVTETLQSDSASTVNLVESNVAGQSLLFRNNGKQFSGVKMKYDDIGSVVGGSFVIEHLNSSQMWEDTGFMVTESNYPLEKKNWLLSSFPSEHVRTSDSLLTPGHPDFTLETLNINGVDEDGFWMRIRLVTPVVTMPILQQLKTHTDRSEFNGDGSHEQFGFGRGKKHLAMEVYANGLNDPDDEKVVYYTGGLNGASAKMKDNKFKNGKIDSRVYIIKLDDDVDTSTPILMSIPWYVKGTATGDVEFTIEYIQLTSDFKYDTSVAPEDSFTKVFSFPVSADVERQLLQFEIPIYRTDPTVGGVEITVLRDASGSRVADTLAGDIVLTGEKAEGRRWRL